MNKFIAIIDALWHPTREERNKLKEQGLHVYDMRTWDTGRGNTLEPVVIVNYEGSVVTNFEITNWDDTEHKDIYDMYKWIEQNDIEDKSFDSELERKVKEVLGYA